MAQSMDVLAPVPGLVASVAVAAGARVAAGDPVVTLQAMKMEIIVESEQGGTVEAVLVREGEEVDIGAVLARVRTPWARPCRSRRCSLPTGARSRRGCCAPAASLGSPRWPSAPRRTARALTRASPTRCGRSARPKSPKAI